MAAENNFATLAAMGVTIIASSGDAGARPSTSDNCSIFEPEYPASSVYVTGVGATQLSSRASPFCVKNGDSCDLSPMAEIVCSFCSGSIITSGGGFSHFVQAPSYMVSVQQTYLANSAVSAAYGIGNALHPFQLNPRGVPDISMLGHNYPIFENGILYYVDGTSASAPLFASMITLINDARYYLRRE